MVDTVFADVAQPDQARIVALNAQYFLKNGGHFVISIKVGIVTLFNGKDHIGYCETVWHGIAWHVFQTHNFIYHYSCFSSNSFSIVKIPH
jgi:hypothetical protein